MQIIQEYPISVEQWGQAPREKFKGVIKDDIRYGVGLTPEDRKDKGCYYLKIQIEKTMTNQSINETVFYARTLSFFKIRLNGEAPTEDFIYAQADRASDAFATEFQKSTAGTNFPGHGPGKPSLNDLRPAILKAISIWNRKYRHDPPTRPDWQSRFRDLPEIPLYKQWRPESYSTLEQDIAFKLMSRKAITPQEEAIFTELAAFYDELDRKLEKLDYKTFTEKDFEDFKNYIFFAFNYLILGTNKLTVFHTFRLVVNEHVSGKNEPITDINFLKYPPLPIVKKGLKYNRASTFNSTVFYSTENIDTALKEIRPPLNKLVTVGVWQPKDVNKALISFPISHSPTALGVNEGAQKATAAFNAYGKHNSPLFMQFMTRFLKLLGREFSKVVDHHYGYLISALLSEQIFDRDEDDDDQFKYDCIIYPSVGNDYLVDNVAIRPSTIDKDFRLVTVLEFEIEEAYYDRPYKLDNPYKITLAKIRNLRHAKAVSEDGKITW